MKTNQKGFTLIELMMTVAIVGVLVSVALPAYQNYIAKAKLANLVQITSSLSTSNQMYLADHGHFGGHDNWPTLRPTHLNDTMAAAKASIDSDPTFRVRSFRSTSLSLLATIVTDNGSPIVGGGADAFFARWSLNTGRFLGISPANGTRTVRADNKPYWPTGMMSTRTLTRLANTARSEGS